MLAGGESCADLRHLAPRQAKDRCEGYRRRFGLRAACSYRFVRVAGRAEGCGEIRIIVLVFQVHGVSNLLTLGHHFSFKP